MRILNRHSKPFSQSTSGGSMRKKYVLGLLFLVFLIGCSKEEEIVPANNDNNKPINNASSVEGTEDAKMAAAMQNYDPELFEETLNYGYMRKWPEEMMPYFEFERVCAEKTIVEDGKEITSYLRYSDISLGTLIEEFENPAPVMDYQVRNLFTPIKTVRTIYENNQLYNIPGDEIEMTYVYTENGLLKYNTGIDQELIMARNAYRNKDTTYLSDCFLYRKTGYKSKDQNGISYEIYYEPAYCVAGEFPLAVMKKEYSNNEAGDHLYSFNFKPIPLNFEESDKKYYYNIDNELLVNSRDTGTQDNDKFWINNLTYEWQQVSLTKYEYDYDGRLIRETEEDTEGKVLSDIFYTYDDGRLSIKNETDNEGNMHIYMYEYDIDEYGNVLTCECRDGEENLISRYRYVYTPTEESKNSIYKKMGWTK